MSPSLASKNSAAILLAASLVDLFPGVNLIGGEATQTCFFYDFSMPFAWQKEFLVSIQERMYALIRENRPVKTLEMIPSNASSFLRHHGLEQRSHAALKERFPLVSLFQIGTFVDFLSAPYVSNLQEIGVFSLVEAIVTPGKIRVIALLAENKQVLKQKTKAYEPISGKEHTSFAKEYVAPFPGKEQGHIFWMPRGERIRQSLMHFWRKKIIEKGYEMISTPQIYNITDNHKLLFPTLKKKKTAEIQYLCNEEGSSDLFSSKGFFVDRLHVFCSGNETLKQSISCLQFIEEILNIFNFDYRYVLCTQRSGQIQPKAEWQKNKEILENALQSCGLSYSEDSRPQEYPGPAVELRMKDVFGKEWPCSFLYLESMGIAQTALVHSLFGQIETFFALLLEQKQGEIPFWLASPQVKILALEEKYLAKARSLQKELETEGVSALCEVVSTGLSQKVYEIATVEKVPYVVLYGEKEDGLGKVTLKKRGSLQQEMVDIQVLKENLVIEKRKEL